jgi:hypothetical protein
VFWSPINSNYMITSIFLVLIGSLVAQGAQARPQPITRGQNTTAVKVYPARGMRIRIVAGKERTLIDLTDDISGCLDLFDPHAPRPIAKRTLGLKVIDRVGKDDNYYLVLLTSAQSNCNVQGFCGAATDHTLIWLKLGAGLKLEDKQAVVLENCRSDIYINDPDYNREYIPPLKLVSGKLAVEYGKTLDDKDRTLSRLAYDRKSPEQGFVITTIEKKSQK